MNILVTGGAGYIGSHTVEALLAAGHTPVVLDNLSRGHREAVPAGVPLIEADIRTADLESILRTHHTEGILHFAAQSLVGASMTQPSDYYDQNVVGSYRLFEAARRARVRHVVFSSTAAVYGCAPVVPIQEDMPTMPSNVYGRTKWMIEEMLADFARVYDMEYVALRYFNAAGAAPHGHLGEDHTPETHLIPLVLQTALGQRSDITIMGTDYDTPDGTCIRDYIHVHDLADAHVRALAHLAQGGMSRVYNLGTGKGYSVLAIIEAARRITGHPIPVTYGARRAGDPPVLVASAERIATELGWTPQYSQLDRILADAWRWHRTHPHGFLAEEASS